MRAKPAFQTNGCRSIAEVVGEPLQNRARKSDARQQVNKGLMLDPNKCLAQATKTKPVVLPQSLSSRPSVQNVCKGIFS